MRTLIYLVIAVIVAYYMGVLLGLLLPLWLAIPALFVVAIGQSYAWLQIATYGFKVALVRLILTLWFITPTFLHQWAFRNDPELNDFYKA